MEAERNTEIQSHQAHLDKLEALLRAKMPEGKLVLVPIYGPPVVIKITGTVIVGSVEVIAKLARIVLTQGDQAETSLNSSTADDQGGVTPSMNFNLIAKPDPVLLLYTPCHCGMRSNHLAWLTLQIEQVFNRLHDNEFFEYNMECEFGTTVGKVKFSIIVEPENTSADPQKGWFDRGCAKIGRGAKKVVAGMRSAAFAAAFGCIGKAICGNEDGAGIEDKDGTLEGDY